MDDPTHLFYPTRQTPDIATYFAKAVANIPAGGVVVVQDVIVPGSRLHGKKANLQRQAGQYVNTFLAFAYPENGRCLSIVQWHKIFKENGLAIVSQQETHQTVDFDEWIAAANLRKNDRARLRALLLQAPAPALEFLTPQIIGDKIQFQMTETTISGKPEAKTQ